MLNKRKKMTNKNFNEKKYMALKNIVMTLTVLVFFGVYVYIASEVTERPLLTGIVMLALCIITLVLLSLLYRYIFSLRIKAEEEELHVVSDLARGLLGRFNIPVAICNETGKIIWHNNEFRLMTDEEQSCFGSDISEISDIEYRKVINAQTKDGIRCAVSERSYMVKSYDVLIEERGYYVLVFTDLTELDEAYRRIDEESTQVAHIVIDNLTELLQFVPEKSRYASNEIEVILAEWAASVGGVLKEYERDHYLFIFHSCHLEEFAEDKFDVINKIREVRVGDGSLPVTVSIGVSGVEGSLDEKEKVAHAALDMALQRGGDQVAVKYANEMVFYGGKTKTVQKRTKVRARVFVNELIHHISQSTNVLIMGHAGADLDSLGACVGIAKLAQFCGVPANIVADADDRNNARFFAKLSAMPGYESIVIDRAEAFELNHSSSILVVVDVNKREKFESPDLFATVNKTVVIDHHIKNDEYETVFSYIEPSASSTCEIVSELLEQAIPDGSLTKDEADILLSGILLDTKQFTRNTGTRTFGAAQYLINQGAVPADAQSYYKSSVYDFVREARFEGKIKTYKENLAIAVNDYNDNVMSDRIIAAKVADKLLELENILASFAVLSIGNDIYISARSTGKINVQMIMEYIGGGGSYNSSATKLENTALEAGIVKLKEAIDKYYSED